MGAGAGLPPPSVPSATEAEVLEISLPAALPHSFPFTIFLTIKSMVQLQAVICFVSLDIRLN
jgi:hypothetical protein